MRCAAQVVLIGLLTGCSSASSSSNGAGTQGPQGTGGAQVFMPNAGGASFGGSVPASGGGTGTGGANNGAGGTDNGGASAGDGGASARAVDGGNPYDPTISFTWPESNPPAGSCDPGSYTGTFTCDIAFIPGFPPGQVTGPVTFTLSPSASGEFLEIKNGRLDATANGSINFGCDLVGQLDCATRTFHADAQNGTWGTPPFGGTFFGSMDGTLDGLTSTLTGTWSLTAGTMAAPTAQPCTGPWSAVK